MPQSISIGCPADIDSAAFNAVLRQWAIEAELECGPTGVDRAGLPGLQVFTRGPDSFYVSVRQYDDMPAVRAEYVAYEEMPAAFRAAAPGLNFFHVGFNHLGNVKEFLRRLGTALGPRATEVWIDTSYASALTLESAVKSADEDACWDWRPRV